MKFLKSDNFLTENRKIGITKKEKYSLDSKTIVEYIIIEKETESCDSRGKRYYYGKKSYIWQRTEKYSILFAALSFVIFSSDTVWTGRPFYHRSV